MIFVAVIVTGVAVATALVLMAMGQNMLYFYSPTQLKAGEAPHNQAVRIGGLVVAGSVKRTPGSLAVHFAITDTRNAVNVDYSGVLPDLFREGQGIVVTGRLGTNGVFQASEVLAKHDEKYMPPNVADELKIAREGGHMVSSEAGGAKP